jgi:hypothetical protein
MIGIMARRALVNSAARFAVYAAGSEEVRGLKPKLPLESAVPEDWYCEVSQRPCKQGPEPQPAAGTLEMAAR